MKIERFENIISEAVIFLFALFFNMAGKEKGIIFIKSLI
jgi:hypothetical protein